MTARIVRALKQPWFKIWGHPLGRLVTSRPPVPCRMEEILEVAAESRVARVAPELQHVLTQALHEGGWFDDAHEGQLRNAVATAGEDERLTAIRTLLAEETRMGMFVGVAVGWELARALELNDDDGGD